MNRHEVSELYDEKYAATYDERFRLNHCQSRSDHEVEVIRRLLTPGGQWLDVACGTGYILGRFPGVRRAGLDLSAAMLKVATQANQDALFFRHGSFLDDAPEWHGKWDLVSCLWYSYCFVESVAEIKRMIANLARWTSDRGACFVPLCSPALLAPDVHLPYRTAEALNGGTVVITAVTWNWIEESGKQHHNLFAPQIEEMVKLFEEVFSLVELVDCPPEEDRWNPPKKAIIARVPRRTA